MPNPERRRTESDSHGMHALVLGCGPAGLLAATHLAERGAKVTVLAPDVDRPWRNRYGAWLDELHAVGLAAAAAESWARPRLQTSTRDLSLERTYCRVDGEALRASLRRRIEAHGGSFRAATIADDAALEQARGTLRVDIVVDASGVPGRSPGPVPVRWQHAWGELLQLRDDRAFPAMRLMDWRPPEPERDTMWRARPSFLYAMPLGGGRVFVEETELIAAHPLPLDVLAARLHRRLAREGVEVAERLEVERCRLPMSIRPAPPTPGVVDFGARAGMIHPATGYSLTRSAAVAPRLAAAVVRGFAAGARGEELAAIGRATITTAAEAPGLRLLGFGADVLASFDGPEIAAFFEAFFTLPAPAWTAMLSVPSSPWPLANVMARVDRRSPASIRRRLWRMGWQRRNELVAAFAAGLRPAAEENA